MLIFGGSSGEAFITPPGDIRAYDVITGQMVWQFHTMPQPGEFGYETTERGLQVHRRREQLGRDVGRRGARHRLLPDRVGRPTTTTAPIARRESLRQLPRRAGRATGKRLWHFQTVHHDLWDYDNVSAPQLVTVRQNGKRVDAVAHAGKTGLPLRLQSRDRRAALADRGASGPAERRAR